MADDALRAPSVKKLDHDTKADGSAAFLDDLSFTDMLWGRVVRSTCAHGYIRGIHIPPLPEGYTAAVAADIPGKNSVPFGQGEMPFLAEREVKYAGEPVALMAGPDRTVLAELAKAVRVDYEEMPACFDPETSLVEFCRLDFQNGDCAGAFRRADQVLEETLTTGLQEHAYLEPQSAIGQWTEDGVTVWGSMQCPFYVLSALGGLTGLPEERLRVVQTVTGGGFGGKEDYPSLLCGQAALLSRKAGGRKVKIVLDRQEDICFTTKRHPSRIHYRTALKNGHIMAVEADILLDGGAYSTLTSIVLQRAVLAVLGPYRIPNFMIHGRGVQTHTPPNGAFRGFGAPQPGFAIEMHLQHLAVKLGRDPLTFRLDHLAEQGDPTVSGGTYHYPVPLKAMARQLVNSLPPLERQREGRYRNGRGFAVCAYGCGLSGDVEERVVHGKVRLEKHADDTVEVLAGTTDMGQGVATVFARLTADILEIPISQVRVHQPDTRAVPDSGPTVGSRSAMTVGKMVEDAALQLRRRWRLGAEDAAEAGYQLPRHMRPLAPGRAAGDVYPDFSWSVNAVTVEVDTWTGLIRVTDARGVYDIGRPLDAAIAAGQMEGGLAQSLGYALFEQAGMRQGRVRNSSFSDYLIPTAMDVPAFRVEFYENPSEFGGGGAKSAGELPVVGGAPACIAAVEMALGKVFRCLPVTPEDVLGIPR